MLQERLKCPICRHLKDGSDKSFQDITSYFKVAADGIILVKRNDRHLSMQF